MGDTIEMSNEEFAALMRRKRYPTEVPSEDDVLEVILSNIGSLWKQFASKGSPQESGYVVERDGCARYVRMRIGPEALEIIRRPCTAFRVESRGNGSSVRVIDVKHPSEVTLYTERGRPPEVTLCPTPVLVASDLLIVEEIPSGVATMTDDVFRHEVFRYDIVRHHRTSFGHSWASRVRLAIEHPERYLRFAKYPGEAEIAGVSWKGYWRPWEDKAGLFKRIDEATVADQGIVGVDIQHPKLTGGTLRFYVG